MTKTVTICPPALAHGLESASNCRLSLSRSIRPVADRADDLKGAQDAVDAMFAAPKAKAPKKAPAPKAIKPVKPVAVKPAPVDAAPKARKLILKGNAPVRKLLKEAAQGFGGTRLAPVGFDSFSAFLNGVPLDTDGNATVSLIPVKGSEPIQGATVKLVVKAGVATVTTVGKAK